MKPSVLVVGAAVLAACNTTSVMEVPEVSTTSNFDQIKAGESKASFALTSLVNDIDRGTQIFAFPTNPPTSGTLCNHSVGENTVTYSGGRQYLGDWSTELGDVFYDTLTQMGYSVAGDPTDLFTRAASVGSAEYLVGGRLVDMRGNFCHAHHWWDGRPLFKYSGELFVEFEWSVLNTLTKEVILKETANGYAKLERPVDDGIFVAFAGAFAVSAESFASNPKMRELALGRPISRPGVATQPPTITLVVDRGEPPGRFDLAGLSPNIVTIRVGQGHGSGFFIGTDGYVVTNQHVVGNAQTVQVRTSQGLEVPGDVVFVDRARDVALVKTPVRVSTPIAIARSLPGVADEVYAVGSPLNEDVHASVTKGIMSALRTDSASGLTFIQSDAAISPGNSGGPLFNKNGEVVGISVAKFTGAGAEGLGLFIPIDDALERLSVSVN